MDWALHKWGQITACQARGWHTYYLMQYIALRGLHGSPRDGPGLESFGSVWWAGIWQLHLWWCQVGSIKMRQIIRIILVLLILAFFILFFVMMTIQYRHQKYWYFSRSEKNLLTSYGSRNATEMILTMLTVLLYFMVFCKRYPCGHGIICS